MEELLKKIMKKVILMLFVLVVSTIGCYIGLKIYNIIAVNPGNQKENLVSVPYAKTSIQPGSLITEEMIGFVEVNPNSIKGIVITDKDLIIGKWSNLNSFIPYGSYFYSLSLVSGNPSE